MEIFYHWFLGQASLLNEPRYAHLDRFAFADEMDAMLQRALPLSRGIYKYLGIVATK